MAEVAAPLFISARLMAALKIDGAGTLHLEALGRDGGRVTYRYVVEDEQGRILAQGNDLSSGVGASIDYRATMGTLLSFLGAAAESYDYRAEYPDTSDDLFPDACMEWAYMHADELAIAHMELEPEQYA